MHAASKSEARLKIALWFGILTGPVAWLVQLQTAYALVVWSCTHGQVFVLRLVTMLFVLIGLGSLGLCVQSWRKTPQIAPSNDRVEMSRFMAALGMMISGLFSALILVQALPTLILSPCIE